jgi:hypothetical protein
MIVLCVSLPEYKMWIFEGDSLIGQKGLSIGISRSKYSNNEVQKEKLIDNLLKMYDNLNKKDIETLMIPISVKSKKEHENRLYRETLLNGCNFEYPIIDGTKYDIIINNYKVQDKCARKQRGSYFKVDFGDYCKDDNAYYWINMPDKSFYIIPETILLNIHNKIPKALYLSKVYDKYKYDPLNNPECLNIVKSLFKLN